LINREWLHENLNGSDTLLITVGDSWTWGDSLGKIDLYKGILDDPKRLTSIYGHLLATKINADHINYGICGGTNIQIFYYLTNLLPRVVNQYKKINVVMTLTEICREAIHDSKWHPAESYVESLHTFLQEYERLMFATIQDYLIKRYPTVDFLIGRNFTYSFEDNISVLGPSHLENTWVDCLGEYQKKSRYPDSLRVMSGISLDPLHALLKDKNLYQKFKLDLLDHYDVAESAITWLTESDLNYKKDTKHPTELGHEIWANYLYNEISNRC
jgi:hypothetical protein